MSKRFMSHELTDDISVWEIEDPELTPIDNLLIWKDRWVSHQANVEKCSDLSMSAYNTALNKFLDWVEEYDDIPITSIGAKYINSYLAHYQLSLAEKKLKRGKLSQEVFNDLEKKLSSKYSGLDGVGFYVLDEFQNTISQRVTILKMFLSYISANNSEQHDFTKLFPKIAKIDIAEQFTDYLTPDELDELVDYMRMWNEIYKDHYPRSSEKYAYRNAFLLTLYALTGARGNEAVHVRLSDIEEKRDGSHYYYEIRIEKGKGNKKRIVKVPKSYLSHFMSYFKTALPDDNYYISSGYKKGLGYTNKPISADIIRAFGNDILLKLGIKKSGLHAFRRGYVTKRVMKDNANVGEVAKEVGNSSAILEKHYLKQL